MALTLFTSPGTGYTRGAFLVSPVYFLAPRIFEDAGFADKMVAIRSDRTSIDFEALLLHLRRLRDQTPPGVGTAGTTDSTNRKRRIYRYAMYAVPTYSNPTGESWDLATRQRLVALAREWDMLVITDDVYDFLGNTDQDARAPLLPRLVTLDAAALAAAAAGADGDADANADRFSGNTLSNCSFSKLLGPGLRVGWLESASGVLAGQLGASGAPHSVGCPRPV